MPVAGLTVTSNQATCYVCQIRTPGHLWISAAPPPPVRPHAHGCYLLAVDVGFNAVGYVATDELQRKLEIMSHMRDRTCCVLEADCPS